MCVYILLYMYGRIHTRYVNKIYFTCAYSLVSFYCFILGLGHGERKPGDFRPEWPCLPSRPRLKHQPGDPGTEGLVTSTCKLWFCLPSFFFDYWLVGAILSETEKLKCVWLEVDGGKTESRESDLPTENPQKVDPVDDFHHFSPLFFSGAWCGSIGFLSINHYCRKSTGNKKA